MWPGTVKHCNGSVFIKETEKLSNPSSVPFLVPAGAGVFLGLWADVLLWSWEVRLVSTPGNSSHKIGNTPLKEFLTACLQHHRRQFNQGYRKRLPP